ncbi:MAG: hypothetical protein H7A24_14705 [Leptospiraceae bacterium]|nr:hypothetical protein [Leptospiraceae bacterium]MCP5513133.1 hypothetical protein [Leptospiraceae bacterium]
MRLFLIIFTIYFLSILKIFADDYHNIQNFYGARATGMGGAYSAISDDTSGAFYNPAGLSFISENHYSINVSSYRTNEQEFRDLFGPGQNYNRISRNYLPNFVGFSRKLGKWNLTVTMLNPVNESFDQTNRITNPIYRRNLSQLDINYNRESFQLLVGPSLAYQFTDRFSIGLTSYYLYDSNKVTYSQKENQYNNNVTVVQDLERRRTSGVLPILGIQIMPFDIISIGASIKQTYVTGGSISSTTNVTSAGRTGGPSSLISQGSENLVAFGADGLPSIQGGMVKGIPQTYEARGGIALFPTRRITITGDMIYTSGYKLFYNRNSLDLQSMNYTYRDPYMNQYERNHTLNFAGGIEFYITDYIVIRLGGYSNKSNNRRVSWWQGALLSQLNNNQGPNSNLNITQNIQYELPSYREIHANMKGYTFGLGFETSSATFSISIAHQAGNGIGFVDKYQLPTQAVLKDTMIFLSGGSKY